MLKIGLTEVQSMMVTSIGLWEERWAAKQYQVLEIDPRAVIANKSNISISD